MGRIEPADEGKYKVLSYNLQFDRSKSKIRRSSNWFWSCSSNAEDVRAIATARRKLQTLAGLQGQPLVAMEEAATSDLGLLLR